MLIGLCGLPDGHPWAAQAADLGSIAWAGDPAGLDQAALGALDLLVLDAGSLEPADLDALRRFRLQRPGTRIAAAVPPGAEPGDPVLAGLVALGVYHLSPPETPLTAVLAADANFATAARWALRLDPATGLPQPERVVVEKTVIREKVVATSSRPTLIAVNSLAPGAGATATALAVAGTLAARGHTVALWSAGGPPPAESVPAGVTVGEAPDPGTLVRRHEWEYVVADFGRETQGDEGREDLRVLVLPGLWARAGRLWPSGPPPTDGAPVVTVAGPGPESRAVAERWAADGLGHAYAWPATPKAAARTWPDLLAPVLPSRSPGKNWWAKRPRTPRPEPVREPEPSPDPGPPTRGPDTTTYVLPPGWGEYPRADGLARASRLVGQTIETAFLLALLAAIVWVAGIVASHGGLPAPVGRWAITGYIWEQRVLTAVTGR